MIFDTIIMFLTQKKHLLFVHFFAKDVSFTILINCMVLNEIQFDCHYILFDSGVCLKTALFVKPQIPKNEFGCIF